MLRQAKNGCNNTIKFQGKGVYYDYFNEENQNLLGDKIDKTDYLISLVDPNSLKDVQKMLTDWELYENGWYISSSNNTQLFYYLCQIGNSKRPIELNYFN
jgi:hypothetical protein